MVNCSLYVYAYGKNGEFLKRIREAGDPPKVTKYLVEKRLGLKSTSYRGMIPLLKKFGFIDDANVPNETNNSKLH